MGKYVLLFIGKFGILKTGLTLLISLGLYAVFFGFWGALGLVLMILLHELGHVVEIRRQGMKATAPLFIPFMGAAIFQRSHPTDALKQAQIGIAGPLAGTVAATAAFVLFGLTHNSLFLFWAWIGFYLNLFNLIPFGMLDGGWILAAASKWFQLLGLAALALAVLFFHLTFGPLLLILLIFGIPTMIARFRNDSLPYYQSVPTAGKVGMGLAWLVLVGYLGYASMQAYNLLTAQTALG
ncbi:MAG: site-2 protease family protein [Candidatus Dormibacteraeota bacterium]|uniref:Site-2 protease family protein n=1 Tax=Candidatus Dormiibacter inghamiae TaxID=3127013 RepID=A0A934NE63_9BACT|nr:site-2 protease family protein [Candidatus Dormibacteraeota bacterium]